MANQLSGTTLTLDFALHVRLRPGRSTAVLVHGIPGSAASWNGVVEILDEEIGLVIPDLLGFGLSGRSHQFADLSAVRQAERLEAALDVLAVDSPILVGHDFGGPVVLEMLRRSPSRYSGLVLAATNAMADTPIPLPISLVNLPVLGRPLAHVLFSRPSLKMMCRTGARLGRVDTKASVGDDAQSSAIRIIFTASLRRLKEIYSPLQDSLETISVPTVVLWGDRDPFFSVAQGRRMAASIPNALFETLHGSGHFVPEEQPAAINDAILKVLAARTAASSR